MCVWYVDQVIYLPNWTLLSCCKYRGSLIIITPGEQHKPGLPEPVRTFGYLIARL